MEVRHRNAIAVLLILAIAAALRFGAAGIGESSLSYQADERFYNVSLPISLSWTDLNPHRFYYPALFWYILFFVDRLTFRLGRELGIIPVKSLHHLFEAEPIPWFVLARSLNAIFGTATVGVTYLLGRRLYSEATALLAAIFLTVSFLHVRDSALATVDAPATFFAALTLLGAAGVLRGDDSGSDLLAAVAAGLATATKYNMALVLVAVAMAYWLRPFGDARSTVVRRLAGPLVRAALISAAVFLLVNPYLIFDWRAARADLAWELEYQGTGQFLDLGPGWPYHLSVSLRYGVGFPLLAFALLGAVGALVRRDAGGLVLLSFAVPYFAVMGHSRAVFVRYMVPLVPVLCVLAALAVLDLASRLAPDSGKRSRVACILTAIVAAQPLYQALAYGRIMRSADTRVEAYEFVQRSLPAGASVATYGLPIIWNSTFPSLQVVHCEKGDHERWIDVLDRVKAENIHYFLTHHSPLTVFSPEIPELEAALRKSATPIAEFDFADRSGGFEPKPVYDVVDGFYLPVGGFRGVVRPGPLVRLYRLD